METVAIILLVLILLLLLYKEFFKKENIEEVKKQATVEAYIQTLMRDFRGLNETVDKKMGESQMSFQRQSQMTMRIVEDVTKKLTEMESTNKQVIGFAEQLKSLENILKNPKQRGILGEYFLETLLSNSLPPDAFKMQYKFKDGTIVDAAIFLKGKIVPVDAKFSLEGYNRVMEETSSHKREDLERQLKTDLKLRIDETSKYVKEDENTLDFALMFIPADGIFYNLLSSKIGTMDINAQDLIKYAFSKKVIIVSPMTFFAYLQTIMQALKNMQIEESVKEVIKNVQKLGKHLGVYDEHMKRMGTNLKNTVGSYSKAYKEFEKIDKDILKVGGESSGIKALEMPIGEIEED